MNNIVDNWQNILDQANNRGIPINKPRGILREYLQVMILDELYKNKEAKKLSFIGGTSLRLLRGLDRFSEDLDFDNLGLEDTKIIYLFNKISRNLNNQNIANEFSFNILSQGIGHGSIKFIELMKDLKITTDPREKLRIEIDFTSPKEKRLTEIVTYTGFGFAYNVITNNLGTLFVQKANAFLNRKDPKARDMYDLMWFLSRNEKPAVLDKKQFYAEILEKYENLKDGLPQYKRSLAPFLFNPKNVEKLDLIGGILKMHL